MSRRQRVIGLLRETKTRWERRVPLTPNAVARLKKEHDVTTLVQPSRSRIFTDGEYREAGAILSEDLADCNTIFGVKEIKPESLLPNKSYVLFSHVIKAQPYNMPLLDSCLERGVRLFDYEAMRAQNNGGKRLVAFGMFAGYAGMIDTLRGLGERLIHLGYGTPFMGVSNACFYPNLDAAKRAIIEMGEQIRLYGLPSELAPFVVVFTGDGNVSRGAQEIFKLLPHTFVHPDELPSLKKDPHKLYGCVVKAEHAYVHAECPSRPFDKEHYYAHPEEYRSVFPERIASYTSCLVNGVFWNERFPRLMTNEDMHNIERTYPSQDERKFLMLSDITCDIEGSVQFFKKSTTVDRPFYVYNPLDNSIRDDLLGDGVAVLGIENLPCELPRDASSFFSNALLPFVPGLAQSDHSSAFLASADKYMSPEVFNSCIVADGKLTPPFEYIAKLRMARERHSSAAISKHKKVEEVTRHMNLRGHLFDSGFINHLLDLLEEEADFFQVVSIEITPNRSKRSTLFSTAIISITCSNDKRMSEIVNAATNLANRMPASQVQITLRPAHSPSVTSAATLANATDAKNKSDVNVAGAGTSSTTEKQHRSHRVLLLGSGMVAGPLVEYLSRDGQYYITIASQLLNEAKMVAGSLAKVSAVHLDASNRSSLQELVQGHDIVISLLPATMHVPVAEACLKNGKHLITASYVAPAMRELDERAKAHGLTFLNEIGLDPGLDHLSAMQIIDSVKESNGRVEVFESWCGGLPSPEAADNPFRYRFSWSPAGALTATQNPAIFQQDGKLIEIPAGEVLCRAKPMQILPSLSLEGYPNRNSMVYGDLYGIAGISTVLRGTLRYQGFSELMDSFVKLGLLDQQKRQMPQSFEAMMLQLLKSDQRRPVCDAIMDRLQSLGFGAHRIQTAVDAAKWLGLTSKTIDPNQFRASSVFEAFCGLLQQQLRYQPAQRDMVLLNHSFRIRWPDERGLEHRTSRLISYGGDGMKRRSGEAGNGSGLFGYSAMARTVGIPVAIATKLVSQGQIQQRGVLVPLNREIYRPMLAELAEEGIVFEEFSRKIE